MNNKGAATTIAILAMTGMLGFGGYKGCSKNSLLHTPKFNVGDCLNPTEGMGRIENDTVYLVTNRDDSNYELRTIMIMGTTISRPSYRTTDIKYADEEYHKAECPTFMEN